MQGTSFYGKMATYEGGGYTQLLGKTKEESLKIIEDLKVSIITVCYHPLSRLFAFENLKVLIPK